MHHPTSRSTTAYQFRDALPHDVDAALPLIYSAGPKAIEYGFACQGIRSHDFMRYAFVNGKGFLGYQNHTVATQDGVVVGIAAVYNLSDYIRLTLQHLLQLWHFYPARQFVEMALRGNHLKSVMPPPAQAMHYLAHFGVSEALRGQGVGTSLLNHERSRGRALGRTRFAIDVAVDNPRAQALYERYGFAVAEENAFSGPRGKVPDGRRMVMPL